jgi:outer membrane autotransporter protein
LGDLGTGVLTIAEAGRAVVDGGTGTVAIASNSGSLGTPNIGAPEGETPLAPGQVRAATVAFGDGTGAVVFNHTDTGYTFALAITGDGALRFLSGRTILTGDSGDFDGTTALSGGELVVNGTLGGTTTFASGSRLSGTGRVGPTVLESGATVAPGNSIGTLTVDGDLTFNSGTVYEVEVNPTGAASDLIVVNGTAFLDGTVTHIGEDGAYRPSADYVILTATNGFDGTRFDGVTSDYYFLDPSLLYGSNDVTLRLLRNNIAFAAVAETANQRAAGDGADSLSLGNDLYDALSVLSAPTARGALDQISGEIHASVQSALLEQTGQLRRSIGHRAADLRGDAVAGSDMTTAGSAEGQFTTWAQAFGNWGHAESDGNAAAMDHDQRGLLFGGDVRLGERTRLGVTAGSSRSSASVDDRASSATGDTLHLGVYGGTAVGPWRFIAGASHSWHEIETDRSIAFAGFTDRPTASYDARTAQVFGEAAYDVSLEPVQLQPFVGLAHTRHDVSSFSESGGAAALAAESADAAATFSTIGLRAATDFAVSGMTTTLRGSLAWQHTLDDVTPSTRLSFGGGTAFSVDGTPLGRDAALIETGIDVAVSDAVTFGASYDGRFDDAGHEHGARARLSIRF